MKKIIGKRVLIEQVLTAKPRKIIVAGAKQAADNVDYAFTVLALGTECPKGELEVAIGDKVIFSQHVTFEGVKIISEERDAHKQITNSVSHVIVHYDDIIAVE
jgi:co-chaperonin GroES (HSP10)